LTEHHEKIVDSKSKACENIYPVLVGMYTGEISKILAVYTKSVLVHTVTTVIAHVCV
jgi:hypothetical protein